MKFEGPMKFKRTRIINIRVINCIFINEIFRFDSSLNNYFSPL